MVMTISIARQFSDCPAGRHKTDGPFSGEQFRENLLIPALKNNNKVLVDLDGALGYGSSFLEEAFGGLVRNGFSASILRNKLSVKSSIAIYERRIWGYIDDADRLSTKS